MNTHARPRRLAVLTGKRGGYGAMKPLLKAIDADPGLELQLIVTDQHLNPAFGRTITEVERDFTVTAAVDLEQADDSALARAQALGTGLQRMGPVLSELAPDILCLYGDRGEVLATAVAAIHLGIPIAHMQGGDITGNVDELMRHAMTKLSHLHFPSTEDSGARIRAMGEEPWRVHVVGDNHIDPIVAKGFTDAATLSRRFSLTEGEAPILVLQHPETTRVRDHYADMKALLEAVLELGRRTIVVYPCSDAGYQMVVKAIDEVRDHPLVSVHKNIDAPDFWGLQAIAAAMVGNSSAGLIETPYACLPAVNVGQRQVGRLRAANVIDCEAEPHALRAALAQALSPAFAAICRTCDRPFGDGLAWKRILDVLRDVPLGARLLDKRMTY